MRANERKGKRKKKWKAKELQRIKNDKTPQNISLNRCKGISDGGQIMRLITKKAQSVELCVVSQHKAKKRNKLAQN